MASCKNDFLCTLLYNTDTSLLRTVRLVPEMPKSYFPYLYNMDTSVGSVGLLSVLKRFDCIIKFYKFDKFQVKNRVHKRGLTLTHTFLFYFNISILNCQNIAKIMHSCVTLLLILKPTGYVPINRERKGTRTGNLLLI